MSRDTSTSAIRTRLADLSTAFTQRATPAAIILAAGQGKRIKSRRSKMLHSIWGVPTVVRVARAATLGLNSPDQVVVVGIKACDVAEALGRQPGRMFVYQAEQKGTGHAVQTAINALDAEKSNRDFFVFPGDMGLIDTPTVHSFRESFTNSGAHMMVMVGTYTGDPAENYYGRILRVPEKDDEGTSSADLTGKIIQIIEYKDILALSPEHPYTVSFREHSYSFTRDQLLKLREYNSGLYAFQGKHLAAFIRHLGSENAQGELYLTDLIFLFNQAGLSVAGTPPLRQSTLMGFNDKAVLRQMHAIAREDVYEKLSKIISIADQNDFFIAEDVVEHILELDRRGAAADIGIGAGVSLGAGVRLAEGVHIERGAQLEGNIILGKGVLIGESARLSAFAHQTLRVGESTIILKDNVLKGNITIGAGCLIEAPVRLTGSDEDPLTLGDRVRIKGDSYIYGSRIESECFIVNCILRRVKVSCQRDTNGDVIPVCYIFPQPTGRESISSLD